MELISFHELYEAHSRHVFRYALSLCGNTADAEHITMTVFFKAWTAEPLRGQSARAYRPNVPVIKMRIHRARLMLAERLGRP